MLWTYFFLQDFLLARMGSPYILLVIATPNLERSYGVTGDPQDIWRLFNPGWI